MRVINDWDNVQENSSFENIRVGAYAIRILRVEDVADKEYLKIEFDIAEGEYKGYFKKLAEQFPEQAWRGVCYRSYKSTATSFFKAFITAIEKSNPQYRWNWNEQTLIGKFGVGVFGEEEYLKDNEIKVSVKCVEIRSLQALREGKIKIPAIKKYNGGQAPVKNEDLPFPDAAPQFDINDEDLPF